MAHMKTPATKTSKTASRTATQAANQPFFAKTGSGGFFAPSVPAVQMKMTVNKPGDKFEQEADKMADKVMRMASPPAPVKEEKLQKAEPENKLQKKEEEKLQRKGGDGTPTPSAHIQSAIHNKTTGGQPLGTDVRSYMEPRFNANFGNIRVHTDPEAASLNNQLSARAFTYQNHVFFSRDQYQPGTGEGKHLLAHELTHTIQQGHAIQRSPQVSTTTTPPPIQRLGIQDALDYFADKAYYIPGFRLLTIIMGFNPINRQTADRSAANILRALIELIPGGHFITQALDNHGVFNKAGAWVEQKLAQLADIGSDIGAALKSFLDSLGWSDIFDLGGVWERAKRIFTEPIRRVISFATSVVTDILKLVKDAILKPLAALAQGTRGYDLLKALLGEDPITGEPVPRNADTLIGGFMKLIGQEDIWGNLKKGNAVARAWAWFQGVLEGLLGFARAIPRTIINTISSLTFQDIITVAGAFTKIVSAFVNIAGSFFSWALNQVISLLEILFSVVAPGVMPYIAKAKAAFTTILKNPIGFVGNLVRAGKQGFQLFAGNILEHLKAALIKWIVGPLAEAGVYIPKSFSLMEIIKLVLSVLGLTWQAIRTKLVKIIPEPVLVGLEKTAGILVTLVKDGPVAAWKQIKTELGELKDQLIAQITQMISVEVVKAAIMKLVSMLNPAGAVVQAILAIYNTVTFFIEKAQQIGAVVASFIDSIAAIAAGQVAPAAKRVEQTMANTLTVIIAFLAKFAGLGGIPDKVVGIIKKIRQPIDKGMDKIVGWLGGMLAKAKNALSGNKDDSRNDQEKARDVKLARQEAESLLDQPGQSPSAIRKKLPAIQSKCKLTLITLEETGGQKYDILVKINPEEKTYQRQLTDDEYLAKIGDGSLSLEQKKAILDQTKAIINNNEVVDKIFAGLTGKPLLTLLTRINSSPDLTGGYKLQISKEGKDKIRIRYFGLFNGGSSVVLGEVKGKFGRPVGWAEIKGKTLSLDFLVPETIKSLGIVGVGTKMFELAYKEFESRTEEIEGTWLTIPLYESGMSDNLKRFIANFQKTGSRTEAAKATWTYARAKEKGYTEVKDVSITQAGGQITAVSAVFVKPSITLTL
jgi:hypothetical protein